MAATRTLGSLENEIRTSAELDASEAGEVTSTSGNESPSEVKASTTGSSNSCGPQSSPVYNSIMNNGKALARLINRGGAGVQGGGANGGTDSPKSAGVYELLECHVRFNFMFPPIYQRFEAIRSGALLQGVAGVGSAAVGTAVQLAGPAAVETQASGLQALAVRSVSEGILVIAAQVACESRESNTDLGSNRPGREAGAGEVVLAATRQMGSGAAGHTTGQSILPVSLAAASCLLAFGPPLVDAASTEADSATPGRWRDSMPWVDGVAAAVSLVLWALRCLLLQASYDPSRLRWIRWLRGASETCMYVSAVVLTCIVAIGLSIRGQDFVASNSLAVLATILLAVILDPNVQTCRSSTVRDLDRVWTRSQYKLFHDQEWTPAGKRIQNDVEVWALYKVRTNLPSGAKTSADAGWTTWQERTGAGHARVKWFVVGGEQQLQPIYGALPESLQRALTSGSRLELVVGKARCALAKWAPLLTWPQQWGVLRLLVATEDWSVDGAYSVALVSWKYQIIAQATGLQELPAQHSGEHLLDKLMSYPLDKDTFDSDASVSWNLPVVDESVWGNPRGDALLVAYAVAWHEMEGQQLVKYLAICSALDRLWENGAGGQQADKAAVQNDIFKTVVAALAGKK